MEGPLCREAQALAFDIALTWRLRYGMPPTDERFLSADEEEMVVDLLAQQIRDRAVEQHDNPVAASAVHAVEGGLEGYVEAVKAFPSVTATAAYLLRRIQERDTPPPPLVLARPVSKVSP
jgi:hypothetical protein